MKLLPPLLLSLIGCSLLPADEYGVPYYSVGDLSTAATGAGDPDLDWKIQHPSSLSGFIDFDPATGSLTTKAGLRVSMHIVGIGSEGYLHQSKVAFWASENSGAWNLLFEGTPLDLKAREAVYERELPSGTTLALSGRRLGETGLWHEARTSTGHAPTFVQGLQKGDSAPFAVLNNPQAAIAGYLSTEAGNNAIQIGPMQMLFCFELNAAAQGETKFDLQDLIVLVSFEAL